MKRTISVLGSTGSVGRQTLDVAEACGFEVAALTVNSSVKLAEEQDFNHYLTFGPEEGEKSVEEIERRLADGTYPGGDFTW